MDSSVIAERFDPEGSNMIAIRHFTGSILLSEFEANHLRTLLVIKLDGVEPMSAEDAEALVQAQEEIVAEHTA